VVLAKLGGKKIILTEENLVRMKQRKKPKPQYNSKPKIFLDKYLVK